MRANSIWFKQPTTFTDDNATYQELVFSQITSHLFNLCYSSLKSSRLNVNDQLGVNLGTSDIDEERNFAPDFDHNLLQDFNQLLKSIHNNDQNRVLIRNISMKSIPNSILALKYAAILLKHPELYTFLAHPGSDNISKWDSLVEQNRLKITLSHQDPLSSGSIYPSQQDILLILRRLTTYCRFALESVTIDTEPRVIVPFLYLFRSPQFRQSALLPQPTTRNESQLDPNCQYNAIQCGLIHGNMDLIGAVRVMGWGDLREIAVQLPCLPTDAEASQELIFSNTLALVGKEITHYNNNEMFPLQSVVRDCAVMELFQWLFEEVMCVGNFTSLNDPSKIPKPVLTHPLFNDNPRHSFFIEALKYGVVEMVEYLVGIGVEVPWELPLDQSSRARIPLVSSSNPHSDTPNTAPNFLFYYLIEIGPNARSGDRQQGDVDYSSTPAYKTLSFLFNLPGGKEALIKAQNALLEESGVSYFRFALERNNLPAMQFFYDHFGAFDLPLISNDSNNHVVALDHLICVLSTAGVEWVFDKIKSKKQQALLNASNTFNENLFLFKTDINSFFSPQTPSHHNPSQSMLFKVTHIPQSFQGGPYGTLYYQYTSSKKSLQRWMRVNPIIYTILKHPPALLKMLISNPLSSKCANMLVRYDISYAQLEYDEQGRVIRNLENDIDINNINEQCIFEPSSRPTNFVAPLHLAVLSGLSMEYGRIDKDIDLAFIDLIIDCYIGSIIDGVEDTQHFDLYPGLTPPV